MADLFQSYLFRVILIPAGVFLAVFYGGGYATGLEIMTYLSSSGPVAGLFAIGVAGIVFGTVIFLVYELGRLYRVYDYQAFSKVILGKKAAPLYEIFFILAMFLTLAYTATAGGAAMANHFGFPRYGATLALLALVVFLTYHGRRVVEMTMVATAIMLLFCALAMAIVAVYFHGDAIGASLQISAIAIGPTLKNVSIYTVAIVFYVPIVLYSSRDLRTRKETLVAGYVTGISYMLPAVCMHLTFLSRYPEVMEQTIPNVWIAREIMPASFGDIFTIVLFIAIVQTGVGLLHGFLERLDNWSLSKRNRPLSKRAHGAISGGVLAASLLLSGLGIIALLARVFTFSFWLSLVIFVIPVLTIGIKKIVLRKAPPHLTVPLADKPSGN